MAVFVAVVVVAVVVVVVVRAAMIAVIVIAMAAVMMVMVGVMMGILVGMNDNRMRLAWKTGPAERADAIPYLNKDAGISRQECGSASFDVRLYASMELLLRI